MMDLEKKRRSASLCDFKDKILHYNSNSKTIQPNNTTLVASKSDQKLSRALCKKYIKDRFHSSFLNKTSHTVRADLIVAPKIDSKCDLTSEAGGIATDKSYSDISINSPLEEFEKFASLTFYKQCNVSWIEIM